MAITWDDVVAVAPDLEALTGASGDAILAIVDRQVNATTWGALADDGRRYLAAHIGTLARRSANGGLGVSSETVGPLSRSYAMPSQVMGSLGLTAYGAEYQRLVRLLPSSIGWVA